MSTRVLDAMELRGENPMGRLKLQMLASEEKRRLSPQMSSSPGTTRKECYCNVDGAGSCAVKRGVSASESGIPNAYIIGALAFTPQLEQQHALVDIGLHKSTRRLSEA